MSFLRVLPVLLALSTLACASLRPPLTCPEQGGAPWTEVTSAHFVLRTDAPPAEGRALVAQWERLYGALAYVMQRPASAEGRIEAVRFERRKDLYEVAGHSPRVKAYFEPHAPGDLEPRPTLVLRAEDSADEANETLLHELAHRFLHERYSVLPIWLDEGLAKFYETLHIADGRVVLGATGGLDFSQHPYFWSSWRGQLRTVQVPARLAPTVRALAEMDRAAFHVKRAGDDVSDPSNKDSEQEIADYAAAWRLVHYFVVGPDGADRQRFFAFLEKLGRGEPGRDAFLAVFGAEMPRLEPVFHAYLTTTRQAQSVVSYRTADAATPVSDRAMSDAEVHLLWARLLPLKPPFMDVARRQLEEALAREPASLEARYVRATRFLHDDQPDDAAPDLEALLAARPDDPSLLLARIDWYEKRAKVLKQKAPEVPPDLADHLARTAVSSIELWAAARYTRGADAVARSFGLLDRALALDPLCWRCQGTRAELLEDAGKLDAALAAVNRAIALLPEGASAKPFLAQRRRIEQARAARPVP